MMNEQQNAGNFGKSSASGPTLVPTSWNLWRRLCAGKSKNMRYIYAYFRTHALGRKYVGNVSEICRKYATNMQQMCNAREICHKYARDISALFLHSGCRSRMALAIPVCVWTWLGKTSPVETASSHIGICMLSQSSWGATLA